MSAIPRTCREADPDVHLRNIIIIIIFYLKRLIIHVVNLWLLTFIDWRSRECGYYNLSKSLQWGCCLYVFLLFFVLGVITVSMQDLPKKLLDYLPEIIIHCYSNYRVFPLSSNRRVSPFWPPGVFHQTLECVNKKITLNSPIYSHFAIRSD